MSHLRHLGASSWTTFGLFAKTWVDSVANKVILGIQVTIKPAWISKWASSYASLTPSVGWTSKWLGWSDQLLGLLVLLGRTNCYLLHRGETNCCLQSADGQLGSVKQHLEINANSFVWKSKCENHIAPCTEETLYRKGWSNQVTQYRQKEISSTLITARDKTWLITLCRALRH